MNVRDPVELAHTALLAVAPDLAGERIDPDTPFRDQFDFDSIDFMHFVADLAKATGLDISERDYPRLRSPHDCARYLGEHGWRAT